MENMGETGRELLRCYSFVVGTFAGRACARKQNADADVFNFRKFLNSGERPTENNLSFRKFV
jgi:hypothetical protein